MTVSVPSVPMPVRMVTEPPPAKSRGAARIDRRAEVHGCGRPLTVRLPPPSLPLRSMRAGDRAVAADEDVDVAAAAAAVVADRLRTVHVDDAVDVRSPSSGVTRPMELSLLSRMTLPPPPSGEPPTARTAPVSVKGPNAREVDLAAVVAAVDVVVAVGGESPVTTSVPPIFAPPSAIHAGAEADVAAAAAGHAADVDGALDGEVVAGEQVDVAAVVGAAGRVDRSARSAWWSRPVRAGSRRRRRRRW